MLRSAGAWGTNAFGQLGESMFGMGSPRVRVGLVLAGFIATAALTVVVVQANASGTRAAKAATVTKRLSLKQAAAAAQANLRSQAGPQASAIVAGSPATVSCGQTITANTTLTGNLDCPQNGLSIAANDVVLNLDGHSISGPNREYTGIEAEDTKDTVENGYIDEFETSVAFLGAEDVASDLQASYATYGIEMVGPSDEAKDDTAAEIEEEGVYVKGSDDTAESDHLLNNNWGLYDYFGSEDKIIDNVANGNKLDGIIVVGSLDTLTGNVTDFNGELGIDADSPQIDGGSNKAMGNGTKEQCRGVVCS